MSVQWVGLGLSSGGFGWIGRTKTDHVHLCDKPVTVTCTSCSTIPSWDSATHVYVADWRMSASIRTFLPSGICASEVNSVDPKRHLTSVISAVIFQLHFQFQLYFYSAPQCSHCKRCTSYGNSVCLSIRPSVTHRYCVKTTVRSTVQFALSIAKCV